MKMNRRAKSTPTPMTPQMTHVTRTPVTAQRDQNKLGCTKLLLQLFNHD